VLIRVDHNVVKAGKIEDPFRIDSTLGTLFHIVSRGGRPVLMTHVGRPRDKKTGRINCSRNTSVDPLVAYLQEKLRIKIETPPFSIQPDVGITDVDSSIQESIQRLKDRKLGAIYLPNIRWFQGEQTSGPERTEFAQQLSSIADIFVNDAFGSWQPDVSTFDIAKYLPSYAGFLMQQEVKNLNKVLDPTRPFLAIVAGAKYDTKIGPLKGLYQKVDHLILGGVIYNTFIGAESGVDIAGVPAEDVDLALELVLLNKKKNKIVKLPFLVESKNFGERKEGTTRTIAVKSFRKGDRYAYILDAAPDSFHQKPIRDVIRSARTIFINAVMGLTPQFSDGSRALYEAIDENSGALKLYAGGDTLLELKNLCPGIYMRGLNNPDCYYFTGGGTVLKALEEGSPFRIKPVEPLVKREAQ
jgi:phosphoglycerate kinase